jgi:hypothetical protein
MRYVELPKGAKHEVYEKRSEHEVYELDEGLCGG